ncbi:MAG: hypothetical protein ACYTFA_12435 [Planctomycetota bacterium]|jgi:hypothetical protein
MTRSGWECKAAASVLGIPTSNVTRQVWPHFDKLARLIEGRPHRAIATMAARMCQEARAPIPGPLLDLAWQAGSEVDRDEVSKAIDVGMGTAHSVVIETYRKLSRLMLADPLLTWIDLAEAAAKRYEATVAPMDAIELERRIKLATGRLPRSLLRRQAL